MDIGLFIQMIIFALLAIAILVTVHEYGHYIVAKKLGIKVLRFSVGFGKPIWSKVAGVDQTEYVISKWPLGGYVKMLDERDCDVPPEEVHRAFNRQPIVNRILVLVAGPAFNFILAIAFFWLVFVLGVQGTQPLIGTVVADSPAANAGLQEEDKIVSVNGQDVLTWSEAHLELLDGVIASDAITLEIQHAAGGRVRRVDLQGLGNRKTLTEPNALLIGLGITPWSPKSEGLIGEVSEGSPAAAAGLQAEDTITAVNGQALDSYVAITQTLRKLPGESVALQVRRGNESFAKQVTLDAVNFEGQQIGRLGVLFKPTEAAQQAWESRLITRQYEPLAALKHSTNETWKMSTMMLGMLGKMVIGQVSIKNISGPLNIARFAGYTARQGPAYYIRFLALLSLSLGVLNLLPIPMLDGGQIVYQLAEAVKGSPLSMRAEIVGQQIGIALLFMLMFFAFRNDIVSIFG